MVELGTSPEKQEDIYKKLKDNETPVLLLVNKVDLSKNEEQVKAYLDLWQKILTKAETFIISAINNFNLDTVLGRIRK